MYQLFDLNNKEITSSDLQDRSIWYKHGVRKEDFFVEKYGQKYNVQINPNKGEDPTVPDLVYNHGLADLKCQNTPFFYAFKVKINPTYAVTFNLKDAFNYGKFGKNYKNLIIFYWVDWVALKMISHERSFTVKPLTGVWRIDFEKIEQLRHASEIHWYSQRNRKFELDLNMQKKLSEFEPRLKVGENVWSIREAGINAACSYVFDLNNFERLE